MKPSMSAHHAVRRAMPRLCPQGRDFCYFHSRLHRAAKQPVSLIDSFDIPLLEDRCAVQLTVTRVLRALVNKTIDRQSASTLLYGLQLALQSVDRSSWAIGLDTVKAFPDPGWRRNRPRS